MVRSSPTRGLFGSRIISGVTVPRCTSVVLAFLAIGNSSNGAASPKKSITLKLVRVVAMSALPWSSSTARAANWAPPVIWPRRRIWPACSVIL